MREQARLDCVCGVALWQWRYTEPAGKSRSIWAADLADLVEYQAHRPPYHDVRDFRGGCLQAGRCAGQAAGRTVDAERPEPPENPGQDILLSRH